jgi:hypothetical protein
VLFASGIGDVAIPELFVVAVAVAKPLNVALAPLAGAVNVTVMPDSGFENASVTFAWSALPNDVLIGVLCGVPANAVTEFADPAVLVRLNVADPPPEIEAVTL